MLNQIVTIAQGKTYLERNWEKGTNCPCCNQLVKLYKRKMTAGMVTVLCRLYEISRLEWIQVKDYLRENKLQNSHDWTLLRWWGLLIEKPKDESGAHSGYWRITSKGIDFALGKIKVPKCIMMYNGKVWDRSEEQITIRQAFKTKFDYLKLMGDHLGPNESGQGRLDL